MDIVLNASIILKIVGSWTQRIESRNLSIFHFLFPYLIGGASARWSDVRNEAPCVIAFTKQDSVGMPVIPEAGRGASWE